MESRTPKCLLIMLFVYSTLISIGAGDTVANDPIKEKKAKAKESNPAYQSSNEHGYGGDVYQPYYICENETDTSAMSLPAWHYSCKESCMSNHLKKQVNITGARWNFIGPEVNVYKVITNEVCYTSHENMWGYCSQTQTSRPIRATYSDTQSLPGDLFTDRAIPMGGTKYITNSKEAVCDYFSDNTECGKDFQIMRRSGKVTKRYEGEELEMTVVVDGIRTDPRSGFVELDDAVWFWKVPDEGKTSDCGWEKMQEISCSYTDTTDVISCPTIGYTYNVQSLEIKKTCAGDIYDSDGPFPFFYTTEKDHPDKNETIKNAKQGKADPDIAFIDGVNKAFMDLELTYCSSSCDLFARQGSPEEDHVLETPIGTWRYVNPETGNPSLVPCLATSTWKLNDPTTVCHGKDHLLVVDSITGHPGSWDTKKDYVITNEVCNTDKEEIDGDFKDMREKISLGETINITFWTGDILQLTPPYDEPRWLSGQQLFRQNPSWFTNVKLDSSMVHKKDDISILLTNMVKTASEDVLYKQMTSKTLSKRLFDEIGEGVGSITSKVWSVMTGIFGGLTKVVMFAFCLALIYILLLIGTKVNHLIKGSRRNAVNKLKGVSFALDDVENTGSIFKSPRSPSISLARRSKRELKELLT